MTALRLVISSKFVVRSYLMKIVLLFLLACFLLFLPKATFAQSSATASAQSTNYPLRQSFSEASQLPTTNSYEALPAYISPQSPVYANLQVYNIMHALSCIGVGASPIGPCVEYKLDKDLQGKIKSTPVLSSVNTSGGLLGVIDSLFVAMYTQRPLNTRDYLAYLGEGSGVIPDAHAQVGGSGSGVLSPIFALWHVSRNLAYIAMILIFIIIGLMVMFRQRLNPQTVVSIQLALPGLVLGLILITFSYFMASLISDLAFIGTNLVGYYFIIAQGPTGPTGTPADLNFVQKIADDNALTVFSPFVGIINKEVGADALATVFNSFDEWVQVNLRFFAGLIAFQFSSQLGAGVPGYGALVGPVIGLLGLMVTAGDPTAIFGLILSWLAMFVLIYTMIKLLLKLISSFLSIIFLTISAPFQFLAASLPGRQGIVTDWIRNMLCHVLAFPAVLAVFYFAAFILKNVHSDRTYPPFDVGSAVTVTGLSAFPLLGGFDLNFVNLLLAFGALIATPAIPDIICRAIGKAGQAGQLIGQEVQGNIRAGQGYQSQYTGSLSQTAGSLKKGVVGESSWSIDPITRDVAKHQQQWGLWQLLRKP